MLKGYMVRERLGTPALDKYECWNEKRLKSILGWFCSAVSKRRNKGHHADLELYLTMAHTRQPCDLSSGSRYIYFKNKLC